MVKLTIGLTVYNEESFVGDTIDKILSQKFSDFELIIGNNASTDDSHQVINRYKDDRIIYLNRPENIGAIQNYNDIVQRAQGEYFILAGGHDLWTENYIQTLIKALEQDQAAVNAFAKTLWIDIDGNSTDKKSAVIETSGMSPAKTMIAMSVNNQHALYGAFRTAAMKKTRLQKEIIGSGEIFLQEVAQIGSFIVVDNERWMRRQNRNPETRMNQLVRYRNALFSIEKRAFRFNFFPHMVFLFNYLSLAFVIRKKGLFYFFNILLISMIVVLYKLPICLKTDILWLWRFIIKRK